RIYLGRGFSSLFDFCRKELGYSEPEAMLRIQAMRLGKAVPEVAKKIERGELSLSVAAMAGSAMKREGLKAEEAKALVKELEGASKREAERKLAEKFPMASPRERSR